MSSSSSSQFKSYILYINVQEALEYSVTWHFPPDNLYTSHVSIVPISSCPFSAFSFAPSTLFKIHFTFVPEKYASMSKPVLERNVGSYPSSRNCLHISSV